MNCLEPFILTHPPKWRQNCRRRRLFQSNSLKISFNNSVIARGSFVKQELRASINSALFSRSRPLPACCGRFILTGNWPLATFSTAVWISLWKNAEYQCEVKDTLHFLLFAHLWVKLSEAP
jgi:hypothetical protein